MNRCLMLFSVFCLVISMAQAQSVFIVTDAPDLEEPGMGNLGDFLRDLGYSVTVDPGIDAPDDPGGNDSAFHGALSADQVATLNNHDLVIFHRATNSGDFADGKDQWNSLTVPMLNGSSYTPRDSRWQWIPGGQNTDNIEFLFVNEPDHPIFTGVTIADDFVRLFDEGVPQDVNALDTGGDTGNGTLLAETELSFYSAIVDWSEPGEFYPGGPASHDSRIVFFALSRYFEDDGSGAIAWEHYSDDGLTMIKNAVEYSIYGDVTGRTPTGGGSPVHEWALY